MGLEEHSYSLHRNMYSDAQIAKELSVYRHWFDKHTVDLWRHLRMLSILDPFLKHDPQGTWLTVGDGRFGTSATYIIRNGTKALPTDIDITLLEIAKQENMIPDFAYANAEGLPFEENAFDYAYCKQSYHHFPRPVLAVYEMLRASKKAVMFSEPHEFYPAPFTRNLLQAFKHLLKRCLGKTNPHHDSGNYETIGNYVYAISVREFEKIALGLGLPAIAYKKIQDIYITGVENELVEANGPFMKKIQKGLRISRVKEFFKIADPNTIQMIVFKTMPEQAIIEDLKHEGYTFILLPQNPY
jgi:ubiquinone/menaquinone biosynthesis C-methylase UbiE